MEIMAANMRSMAQHNVSMQQLLMQMHGHGGYQNSQNMPWQEATQPYEEEVHNRRAHFQSKREYSHRQSSKNEYIHKLQSSRPASQMPSMEDNFPPGYEQEESSQRSTSGFGRIGLSKLRNRPKK